MTQAIKTYLTDIQTLFATGDAREHSYRGDLANLLKEILPNILPTNEPARIECGAPDYVLTKNDLPVGYIEAKDLGFDLNDKKYIEQFDRYKAALNNLVFTNYLIFDFYRNGECVHSFEIAKIKNKKIMPLPENFDAFIACLQSFFSTGFEPITDSKKLAKMMASKAKLLSEAIEKSLLSDEKTSENSSLHAQMQSFKKALIHDITPKIFADIYAQTIAYGLFAARFHDTSLDTFSRREAAELIPKSNPFLRKLFGFIADYELDSRIAWIIDALAEVFKATNIPEILANFGKSTQTHDPIIHFYETFLHEYDPALRKSRGVWYTPESVVNFIVRSVDEVLKTEFNLNNGLGDSSKTTIKINNTEQEIHKVQILDPATGTGTFLAQIIKHIYGTFKNQQGMWESYVEQHLIPRLNGFEILMASYAMAHLKMDMLLTETGYKAKNAERFKIYLTNSLEEYHEDTGTLFASWLSAESAEANSIKRDSPVMCIIGNPPYSVSSQNKSDWILKLIDDYKKEPNSNQKLDERKHSLDDDYVKFIRYGQSFIEKNNFGVLAYICPHGFLDSLTFRGMRYNLLKTYDTIYTIDLHGNAKKKEVCPDGTKDENVFDIMQGVCITLFIKTGKKATNELGTVYHYDLYGKRDFKYDFLNNSSLKSIPFVKLPNIAPNYFMVQKNFDAQTEYDKGFGVNALFKVHSTGIETQRDKVTIHFSEDTLKKMIDDFRNIDSEEIRNKYQIEPDGRDWKVSFAKEDVKNNTGNFVKILWRPFDIRYTYYTGKSKGFIAYPRDEVGKHLIGKDNNFALIFPRQCTISDWTHISVTNNIFDNRGHYSSAGKSSIAPLYLYNDNTQTKNGGNGDLFANSPPQEGNLEGVKRQPNFDPVILKKFVGGLGLRFVNDHEGDEWGNDEALKNGRQSVIPAKAGIQNDTRLDSRLRGSDEEENTVAEPVEAYRNLRTSDTSASSVTDKGKPTLNPLDILDYVYAVLHSPNYRETYKEFFKIDFPKIPYPTDTQKFWQLVTLGREIRIYHLLEHPSLAEYDTHYNIKGSDIITTKISNKDFIVNDTKTHGKIMINDTQFFDNIPVTAWEFYIGGYQPAQKWLKDRQGRKLSFDDIQHYQKIIKSLTETYRLMQQIDAVSLTLPL